MNSSNIVHKFLYHVTIVLCAAAVISLASCSSSGTTVKQSDKPTVVNDKYYDQEATSTRVVKSSKIESVQVKVSGGSRIEVRASSLATARFDQYHDWSLSYTTTLSHGGSGSACLGVVFFAPVEVLLASTEQVDKCTGYSEKGANRIVHATGAPVATGKSSVHDETIPYDGNVKITFSNGEHYAFKADNGFVSIKLNNLSRASGLTAEISLESEEGQPPVQMNVSNAIDEQNRKFQAFLEKRQADLEHAQACHLKVYNDYVRQRDQCDNSHYDGCRDDAKNESEYYHDDCTKTFGYTRDGKDVVVSDF